MEERLSDTMPIFRDEAERAVLGAILLDGQAVFERLENKLKPESFFKVSQQVLFSALREMNENKITIDQLTVTETLRQKGILEQCGGVGYVTELPQAVPTIANVEYYRDLILDCAVRRDLIRFGHETIKESHDISRPVKSVVEGLDQQFSRFTVGNDTNGILTVSNILADLVDDIEKKMNSLQLYDGIESGFPVLDELTTGFKEEEMIIVGARPSIGKTAFALSMAINMAIHKDVPVGFFSLEMSAADIMRRLLSCESRVPMDRIKRPQKLQEDDLQRIYQTAVAIHKKPLYICAEANMNLLDIKATARMMQRKFGVQVIFIDYIGLIALENAGVRPRHEVVSEISRSLKALSRELKIPLVILAQLNRESEKGDDKEPLLSNVRDSGSIEQDADVVMLLHRPRITKQNEEEKSQSFPTKVIIAKNRNGATDTVTLNFVPRFVRFESVAGEH